MKTAEVKTFWAKIYAAGDIEAAKQVCREECFSEGLCVTVSPCEYIYTGGQEAGYSIGLINYPRFPSSADQIINRAKKLAESLVNKTYQDSFCIVTPENTYWYSRREDNKKC